MFQRSAELNPPHQWGGATHPELHAFSSSANWVYTIVGLVVGMGALGVLVNVLTVYWFYGRQKRGNPYGIPAVRHFILFLCVLDLITCLTIIPMVIHIELTRFPVNTLFCTIYQLLVNSEFLGVALVLTAVALDRLFYFHHPTPTLAFKKKTLFNVTVISLMLAVLITGAVLVAYLSYCNVVTYTYHPAKHCFLHVFFFNSQGVPHLFGRFLLALYILPFIGVVAVYCLIYHKIRNDIWIRKSISSARNVNMKNEKSTELKSRDPKPPVENEEKTTDGDVATLDDDADDKVKEKNGDVGDPTDNIDTKIEKTEDEIEMIGMGGTGTQRR